MRGSVEPVAVARDVASSSPSKPTAALDMMRFQRPNPDCVPLPNGISSGSGGSRKPTPAAAPAHRSSKDEAAPAVATDSSRLASYLASTSLESKQRARAPQPPAPAGPSSSSSLAATSTRSPARDHGHHGSDHSDPAASPSYLGAGASSSAGPAAGAGEVLLQWGHNKRTRGRRDAASSSASASTASPLRRQPAAKIQRRSSAPDKLMPPPSAPSHTRGSNLRVGSSSTPPARAGDAHHGRGSIPHHRSAEERALGKARAEKQRPDGGKASQPRAEAAAAPVMGLMVPDQKQMHQHHHHHHQADHLHNAGASSSKPKLEMPRIFTTLSRKEKEEDFLAIKGTKLPVRPKKRPKNVEKAVNFICPGMWLTDVTRNRYEVREKKCPKKQKHRGLKGMESMDSDSD
ncbi:hypothetical protein EJB05_57322 [Eragrostis curvula]|uniref:DUF1639 domain-containing protein n=1 Tax=Eragrostis curvula TaxID=38414 RepID=A0A5J9SE48_9POAL|nr:hypothetical protein EJB05_57322 [Eragrostis curvula]